jgi:DNA-directed RNA polymerase specialized sigma24 family protein
LRGTGSPIAAAFVGYVKRPIIRAYGFSTAEAEDVIGDAFVDFLDPSLPRLSEGLFLVITKRRACDLLRRRRREAVPGAPQSAAAPIVEARLAAEALSRIAWLYSDAHRRLDRSRFLGVVRGLLEGDSLPEACRRAGVPRGSHGRYRTALRDCFQELPCRRQP